jgi:hypothetical protein
MEHRQQGGETPSARTFIELSSGESLLSPLDRLQNWSAVSLKYQIPSNQPERRAHLPGKSRRQLLIQALSQGELDNCIESEHRFELH